MRQALRNGVPFWFVLVLLPLLEQSANSASISLKDPAFNASGEGNITTTGTIGAGENRLYVAEPTSWQTGQGIRIRRAGVQQQVHDAESGWRAMSPQVEVVYDRADKQQGNASVRCVASTGNSWMAKLERVARFVGITRFVGMARFAGVMRAGLSPAGSAAQTGQGSPAVPVELCEASLRQPTNFAADELRLWVKASAATARGNLQIVLFDRLGAVEKGELELPALPANEWTEVFVPIQGETQRQTNAGLGQVQRMRLQCQADCKGLAVQLDAMELTQDLLTQVERIEPLTQGGAVFSLGQAAGRRVEREVVYHDDTVAVSRWLAQANRPGGAQLFAPAGTYYISQSLPLYSHTTLHCEGAAASEGAKNRDSSKATLFKNTGRSRHGASNLFSTQTARVAAPSHITIENCGFDANGWNLKDFLSVISIGGPEPARQISIRHNHFFDSVFDALSPTAMNCDQGQDACEILQRQYILVLNVDGAWIEQNRLSGGGRIKVGRPGRNFYIRHNQIDLVNDNAITVVDDNGNGGCARSKTPCVTEQVEITDNVIHNPVGVGIFFGADGDPSDHPDMVLRNITIAQNQVTGFFTGAIKGVLPATTAGVNIHHNRIEATRQREKIKPLHTQGILIKRGEAASQAATDIKVAANTLVATGEHAIFSVSGLTFQGDMAHLTVVQNQIRCEACHTIRRGIWFTDGMFQTVEVSNNLVAGTADAITVSANLMDATVGRNQFLNSTSNRAGQINIALDSGQTVKAQIVQNQIQGGANFGIFCRGSGSFNLAIADNRFVGHEGREISKTCSNSQAQ